MHGRSVILGNIYVFVATHVLDAQIEYDNGAPTCAFESLYRL